MRICEIVLILNNSELNLKKSTDLIYVFTWKTIVKCNMLDKLVVLLRNDLVNIIVELKNA